MDKTIKNTDDSAKEINFSADKVFDISESTVFFPIRHHSPACSFHLEKAIEIYNPDCVLIEGPCDTDSLLEIIADSAPPVAIYYSYNKDNIHSACYYPLMEYSPEFTAVKTALAKGIKTAFIDLPYGNKAYAAADNEDDKKNENVGKTKKSDRDKITKNSYCDDYFFQHSKYINALCEKENCRDYNELWEKLFEIPAASVSTENFIRNMFVLCAYSRIDYPEQLMKDELDTDREAFMADNIKKYRAKYSRILVVTGGFHTHGLMKLLGINNPDNSGAAPEFAVPKPKNGESYLISYSFAECDMLSGYASGMPYPGYYQQVYELRRKGIDEHFYYADLLYVTKIARALRKKNNNISLSEEAAAYAMAVGLAQLRGKKQCGVYELIDGIRGAFVKGELNTANSVVLREAKLLMRGKKFGTVSNHAPVPPIVKDFQSETKRLRIDLYENKASILDIISKPKHREISVFFHRLCLLENPFAKQTAGPDYIKRRNTRLVREQWKYEFEPKVTASLIEHSHLGGTILEACQTHLNDLIENSCNTAAEVAALLISAGITALFDHAKKLITLSEELIRTDNSFVSVASAAESFMFLKGMEEVLRIDSLSKLDELIYTALNRALILLPAITASSEKEDFEIAGAIKTLYSSANDIPELSERYIETLTDITALNTCPPSVHGCAAGLLYSAGKLTSDDTFNCAKSYFNSSDVIRLLTGRFLRGLFLTARDVVFFDDFISGITGVLKDLSEDDFMKILPDLRLSFTYFTPMEISGISIKIAKELGLKNYDDLLKAPAVTESEYNAMRIADNKVYENLKNKGYLI